MFGRKKIKELSAELEVSRAREMELEVIINGIKAVPLMECSKCAYHFFAPKYKEQTINQHGSTQIIAICPVCGSRHIKIVKKDEVCKKC